MKGFSWPGTFRTPGALMSGRGRSGHFAGIWPASWPLLTRSGQPAGRDEWSRSGCEHEVAFIPKLATAVRRARHDGVSRQLANAGSAALLLARPKEN